MHVTLPEIVGGGGVTVNETEPVYQPFIPLGTDGDKLTAGGSGGVVSIFTVVGNVVALLPALSVAVHVNVWIPSPLTESEDPLTVPSVHTTGVTSPEPVSLAVIVIDTGEDMNHPLFPFGVGTVSAIVGAIVSILTVDVAGLLEPPELSVAVQLTE